MKDMWNQRYAEEGYAYGEEPNVFFRESLLRISEEPGKLLLPAEGQGRNAVFAALLGWEVFAFDISEEGRKKAMQLAEKNNVGIHYEVGTFEEVRDKIPEAHAVGLVFAHFAAAFRAAYHRGFEELLAKGGQVILEGFTKKHMEYQKVYPHVGGPRAEELLFTAEIVSDDFQNCVPIHLEELETPLSEGKYHIGQAHVVQFIGRKK